MENRKTFIAIWANFLKDKGLSNYQSVKTAIVFADQMEEVKSQLSGSNAGDCEHEIVFIDSKDPFCWKCKKYEKDIQKSVDVGDVKKAANDYSDSLYSNHDLNNTSCLSFISGAEWQSKQQPINPITIKNFITMVKNSSPEIKKLVMDELGVEQKEPVDKVSDAVAKAFDAGYKRKEHEVTKYSDGFNYALCEKLTPNKEQYLQSLQPK